jgi:hypothetical protein
MLRGAGSLGDSRVICSSTTFDEARCPYLKNPGDQASCARVDAQRQQKTVHVTFARHEGVARELCVCMVRAATEILPTSQASDGREATMSELSGLHARDPHGLHLIAQGLQLIRATRGTPPIQ